ncbi:MAG TPA: hypothetical protein VK808_12035 [Bacteroidia bacterium]|nr:hypothetical protein [Bacteroidia bacterium]
MILKKNTPTVFLKRLFACALPFLFLLILYIALDPFNIIRGLESPGDLHWNRDIISSRIFLKNNPKYHFKSFIFGSSRSLAFQCKDWGPYVDDTTPFHFDAWKENLFGIYTKIRYIDSIGNPLENVLIISDPETYNLTQDKSFGDIKDYKITGTPTLDFQLEFLKSFYSDFFFIRYIDYRLFKTYRPYMETYIPSKEQYFSYDEITNDPHFLTTVMQEIASDSIRFYKRPMFYTRKNETVISPACLTSKEISVLKEIKKIFDKHKTNYKIVLSPLYSLEYFNPADEIILKQIFGSDNVFNFSGKNSITNQVGNYYDYSHYKIYIGQRILKAIYKGEKIF